MTDPRFDVAMRLSRAGLPIIPLFGPKEGEPNQRGKRPRHVGWQTAKINAEVLAVTLRMHPDGNIGCVTGLMSGLVCVDIDPRNGGMAWLQANAWRLTAFQTEKTGSGGFHLWFAHPGGWIRSRTGKHGIAPGVELLADGGHQAVIAPSIHHSGAAYEWTGTMAFEDVADFGEALPAWIATVEAAAPSAPRSKRATAEAYGDHEADVEACRNRLAEFEPAVEGAGGDAQTFRACCLGRDHNLSLEAFRPLLQAWSERCSPPWSAEELEQKLANGYRYAKASSPGQAAPSQAFAAIPPGGPVEPEAPPLAPAAAEAQLAEMTSWQDGIATNREGIWRSHPANVLLMLESDPDLSKCFKYNEFTRAVEVVAAPWRDGWTGQQSAEWIEEDRFDLATWVVRRYGKNAVMSEASIHAALKSFTRRHAYHPVREYLDALTWDQKPRLDTWLVRYLGAERSDYHALVGARFLIGAVARIMNPGCKLDSMLVLEGEQGIGKSRAVSILFGDWFTDQAIDFSSKDAAMAVRGHWGVELAEMHSVRRADKALFKSFLSRQVDRQRDAFERCMVSTPRQCVFVGTTNEDDYQDDETGGRRLWPVRCGRVDLLALGKDRNHLWAEAAARFGRGERTFLDEGGEALARDEQDRRHVEDPWISALRTWLVAQPHLVISGQFRITSREIFEGLLGMRVSDTHAQHARRLGRCLRALGFKGQTIDREGIKVWGYTALHPFQFGSVCKDLM